MNTKNYWIIIRSIKTREFVELLGPFTHKSFAKTRLRSIKHGPGYCHEIKEMGR